MNRRVFAASAAGASASALLLPRFGRAGTPDVALDVPGKWREWGTNDDAFAKDFATLGEQKEFYANLATLLEPLKKNPAFTNPMGFEINPYRGIRGDYRDKKPLPIPGHLTVQTFFYYRRAGKVEVNGESQCTLRIFVNSPRIFLSGTTVIADETEDLCYAPERIDTKVPSVQRLSSGWGLTKRTAPIWIPATQERYLNALIFDTNKKVRGNTGQKGTPKPDKWQQADLDAFQGALAKMSDADKKAPAWVLPTDKKLSTEGAPNAKALVVPNPSFFDPSLPRTALQLLCVQKINFGFAGGDDPHVKALRQTILKKFDYPALHALLT